MVSVTINGINVKVKEGTTIIQAARNAGIDVPHLCYWEGLNDIGACRVCVVELKGMNKLVSACNTEVEPGMEILTNSPRVRKARKVNIQLLLSEHDFRCATCHRNGNCSLQKMAGELGVTSADYKNVADTFKWDSSYTLIRDASKCISCMRCVQVCDKIQTVGVWEMIGSAQRTTVGVKGAKDIKDSGCTFCGQCITHCPTGALATKNDKEYVYNALADPDIVTIVQFAPAVRVAWSESMGISDPQKATGKIVSALKQMGFDYVFDTVYAADMTIMEEGSELISRLNKKETSNFPMFTSCCPGWLRFVKQNYPEFVKNLSTAKSPQQMFGTISKTYIAEKLGIDPAKIVTVSIMPCTAKKWECDVAEVNDSGFKDVDYVLITRELQKFITTAGIKIDELTEEPFDQFFGEGTGAGVIFGATGGVMEAALRSAHYLVTGSNPSVNAFKEVRGMDGWKEAKFEIDGIELKVAITNGLGNARKLLDAIKAGEVSYDFVEVMACPGGCSGGGGQPFHDGQELAEVRARDLYDIDKHTKIRFSHENPTVQMSYHDYFWKPLSEISHHLLHTDVDKWTL